MNIAIAQARKTNPGIEIILLGDSENKAVRGCKHYYCADYFEQAERFAEVFVNYSPNPAEYELFCFQRWFVIKEFLKCHPEYNDVFLYCDSDTMLFDDITSDINRLGNAPLAIESEESPGFTFFNKGTIDEFCLLLMWLYDNSTGKDVIHKKHEVLRSIQATSGISDMTAFRYYCQQIRPGEVIAAERPTKIGEGRYSCYDHNVNISNNFRMKNGMKDFKWKNGQPFAYSYDINDYVLFKGIHFQGMAKYQMISFYSDDKLKILSPLWVKLNIERPLKVLKRSIKQFLLKITK